VPGHHRLTFQGSTLAVGKQAEQLADYLDACRRKRNEIDYTGATIAYRNRGRRTSDPREIVSRNGGNVDRDNAPSDEALNQGREADSTYHLYQNRLSLITAVIRFGGYPHNNAGAEL
jgi:hypothetical protein